MKLNLGALKTLGGPKVQRQLLRLNKYAPEILTGVGVVGVVGSTILIARATTKLEPVIEKHSRLIQDLKIYRDENSEYAEDGYQKDLALAYFHFVVDIVKVYGGPVTLQVASLLSIVAAQGISHRRAASLISAYKALEAGFNTYRQRVIEEYGEDKDRDFRTGFRTEMVEDPETGKKKKTRSFDPNGVSPYARFFDQTNPNWHPNPDVRMLFLKNQQNWMNDLLINRGHLFLNEVYDHLGFNHTRAGQSVGWVISKSGDGDNFVDFNIYGDVDAFTRNFVNGGNEPVILLDFNVDGVILDLIDE